MKKLNKNMKKNRNTIESFGCVCGCGCPCSYCAATWLSQHNADADVYKRQIGRRLFTTMISSALLY